MSTATLQGAASSASVLLIPCGDLIPTPDNPRTFREDAKFKELVASIREHGVLVPLLARPHPTKNGKYDVRSGERRLKAAVAANLDSVLTIVREMDDRKAMDITVIENLHREDLTPIEEAKGVRTLLEAGWEVAAIAADLGKSVKWVLQRSKLKDLIPDFTEEDE